LGEGSTGQTVANPAVQRARFLAPGDKLGKHDLIRQIAVGGMAELYLARTMGIEGFEKLVVIKRILPQYAGNASFVNMFLNEARLAATLHHPNIAQVYDIGQEQGEYFFSMEYVHGEDLGSMLRNAHESGVPVSLDAALTLAAGLCAGLHHAHEKTGPDGRPLNVVHRDVSPSNVLVSYDGAVKLVDFGIARVNSTPGSTAGGLKGKISYMSPEQCRGNTALDRRSDIFSVGTILYEMTTGQLPFNDETEYAILNHIVNTDAVPPSKLVADYPPALETIVMRSLSREVDKRYNTAIDLQTDLEDFAHDMRLRVSPLVLARLMSNLFPARLEEWANAKAQGAFFVEQHVVRTLIEDSQVSVIGEIQPPSDDDQTAVTTPPVAVEDPTEQRAAPTVVVHKPTPTPVPQRPTPAPERASQPRIPTNARTQVGVAVATDEAPVRPTPIPRTPVPGVPIVTLQPSQPGTLVSSAAVVHATPALQDQTLRVRVPDAARRSKKTAIVLALVGAAAAAVVTFVVLGSGDDKLAVGTETPRVAPVAEPKPEPKAEPTLEPKSEPTPEPKAEPTLETKAEPKIEPKPAIEAKPEPVKPDDIEMDPAVTPKPTPKVVTKPKPKPTPRIIATKKPPPVVKDPPTPKESPQWKNGESPFLPVRPADKR
jgi:serine/threonine protein kinase